MCSVTILRTKLEHLLSVGYVRRLILDVDPLELQDLLQRKLRRSVHMLRNVDIVLCLISHLDPYAAATALYINLGRNLFHFVDMVVLSTVLQFCQQWRSTDLYRSITNKLSRKVHTLNNPAILHIVCGLVDPNIVRDLLIDNLGRRLVFTNIEVYRLVIGIINTRG